MSVTITQLVEILLAFAPCLSYIKQIIHKVGLKADLALIIEKPLEATRSSYYAFIEDVMTIFGASFVGSVITYDEERAHILMLKTRKDYEKLIKNVKKLFRLIDTHKLEFKEILDRKDWLMFEALIETFNAKKPDWNFFLEHELLIESTTHQESNTKFFDVLKAELDLFNEDLDISCEEVIKSVNKNEKFAKCLKKCMSVQMQKPIRVYSKRKGYLRN